MTEHIYKYPRLYLNARFTENAQISLESDHVHYLKNVLRKNTGDFLRLFNGVDGEWFACVESLRKKDGDVVLQKQIKSQPAKRNTIRLFFSPIKKQAMDFMIEKAVELGVTDLHPVLMNRTENRKINEERMNAHIIEASEQCERMDIPLLHAVQKLPVCLNKWKSISFYAALEREAGASEFSAYDFNQDDLGFMIGPEGGFDDDERKILLSSNSVKPISLGDTILRAETAALSCLAAVRLSGNSVHTIKK